LDSNEIRQDITDRGIEKAHTEMDEALQPIADRNAKIRANTQKEKGNMTAHNSGQMASDASDQTGTTPFGDSQQDDRPKQTNIKHRRTAAEHRTVNEEAVRESFKEAELDPIAETEPEDGEKAA
jgi:hypothetical protein